MTTPGTPLQPQTGRWTVTGHQSVLGFDITVFARPVRDGMLRAMLGEEPDGWHLSISFVNHLGNPTRYPTWDEISHARYALAPNDITMAMLLPPPDQFVDVHPTTFHLHEVAG